MARLVFHPATGAEGREMPLSPATSLLVAIMKDGSPIRYDCGGKALCGSCRVSVADRRSLSPMTQAERVRLAALSLPLEGSVRLACQARAFRDVEVTGLVGAEKEGTP